MFGKSEAEKPSDEPSPALKVEFHYFEWSRNPFRPLLPPPPRLVYSELPEFLMEPLIALIFVAEVLSFPHRVKHQARRRDIRATGR